MAANEEPFQAGEGVSMNAICSSSPSHHSKPDIDNDTPVGGALPYALVSLFDRRDIEVSWIETRLDPAGLSQPRCLPKDVTVMQATFTG
jgi:hypothetical protein